MLCDHDDSKDVQKDWKNTQHVVRSAWFPHARRCDYVEDLLLTSRRCQQSLAVALTHLILPLWLPDLADILSSSLFLRRPRRCLNHSFVSHCGEKVFCLYVWKRIRPQRWISPETKRVPLPEVSKLSILTQNIRLNSAHLNQQIIKSAKGKCSLILLPPVVFSELT